MITFLGMSTRTSGEIRGRQVAERLKQGSCFTDIHNPNWRLLQQNKIVLFVRTWEPNLAKELYRRGYIVGYEIADMPVGDAVFRGAEVTDLSAYVHKECDFFVVNNRVQLNDLAQVTNKTICVIPHHTVNYESYRNPLRRVERVGYVGLPEQLSAKEDIENLCRDKGVEFISIHPNTREECVEIMKTIDVGVVFADSGDNIRPRVVELMKRYKPNTKLSNFQSFGIRTVCTPYESYIEHGGGATRFESTREGMLESLNSLINESSISQLESDNAYIVGQKFHIDEIIKRYEHAAREFIG